MKLIKIVSAAVAATLMLAVSAVAQGSPILNSIVPVSFSLSLRQEAPSTYNPTNRTTTYSYTTVKLTNKDILAILADIAGTNRWPAGTQLGFYYNELLVVGKNGDVLLNAGADNLNGYISFEPLFFGKLPAAVSSIKSDIGLGLGGGVYSGTYTYSPYVTDEFFISQGGLSIYDDGDQYYISLQGGGLTEGPVNFDSSKKTGREVIIFSPVLSGDFDDSSAVVTGIVIAAGKISNSRR